MYRSPSPIQYDHRIRSFNSSSPFTTDYSERQYSYADHSDEEIHFLAEDEHSRNSSFDLHVQHERNCDGIHNVQELDVTSNESLKMVMNLDDTKYRYSNQSFSSGTTQDYISNSCHSNSCHSNSNGMSAESSEKDSLPEVEIISDSESESSRRSDGKGKLTIEDLRHEEHVKLERSHSGSSSTNTHVTSATISAHIQANNDANTSALELKETKFTLCVGKINL